MALDEEDYARAGCFISEISGILLLCANDQSAPLLSRMGIPARRITAG